MEKGRGKGKREGEVERGIWPTQKFWCGTPMAAATTLTVDTSSVAATVTSLHPLGDIAIRCVCWFVGVSSLTCVGPKISNSCRYRHSYNGAPIGKGS